MKQVHASVGMRDSDQLGIILKRIQADRAVVESSTILRSKRVKIDSAISDFLGRLGCVRLDCLRMSVSLLNRRKQLTSKTFGLRVRLNCERIRFIRCSKSR